MRHVFCIFSTLRNNHVIDIFVTSNSTHAQGQKYSKALRSTLAISFLHRNFSCSCNSIVLLYLFRIWLTSSPISSSLRLANRLSFIVRSKSSNLCHISCVTFSACVVELHMSVAAAVCCRLLPNRASRWASFPTGDAKAAKRIKNFSPYF